jgi:cytochrome c biogenesis protein CcmG/thiol:disulfide interchange protein DsbE
MVIRNLAPLLALPLIACAARAPRPTVKVPPLAGKVLDVAAQDLSGRDVRVASAGRVVVVDFFASWCEPCREQLPRLDRLARALGERGLEIYAVSFDDDRAAARDFAARVAVGFPVLWDPGGERLSSALGIERLPTTVVADRRGIIRLVHVGYTEDEQARLEAEIRRLVEEP